jgi:general secretion pathway protein C
MNSIVSTWFGLLLTMTPDALAQDPPAHEPPVQDPPVQTVPPLLGRHFELTSDSMANRKRVTNMQPETSRSRYADVDPLTVEGCSDAAVEGISQLPEAKESLTTLRDLNNGVRRTVRAGGTIAAYRVASIGFNPRLRAPAVWLWSNAGLCQLTLNGSQPARHSDHAGSNVTAASEPPSPRPNLAQRVAAAITLGSDGVRTVTREAINDVTDNIPELQRRLLMSPVVKNGRQTGWKLSFAEGSTLDQLGLQSGDVLRRVGGFDVASPEGALSAYAALRRQSALEIEVERAGEPVTLSYRIGVGADVF